MRKKLRQISPQTILVAVFVLSISLFSVVTLLPSLFYNKLDLAPYLVFHNGAELFGVVVCLSIFGVGWYSYNQSKNGHALFLSVMFLGTGLMGFMHTLSFPGMPPFVTPNSTNKAIQFWLAFRLYYAVTFLASAFIYPETENRWLARKNLLLFTVAVAILTFTCVIYYLSYLPTAFIEGKGLTLYKVLAEYAIIGLLAFSFFAYWKRFSRTKDKPLIFYLSALILSIFSELAFTLYKSAFDTFNMLGHVFEVGAFCLIYMGVFTASVVYPYERIQDTSKKLEVEIAERKRVEGALNRLNRELRAISKCNQVVVRASDEQTLLNEICRIICDDAGYQLAWVGYAENDDAKTIRPVAWAGFDSGYIAKAKLSWSDDTERGRGPAGAAIRSGEIVYVQDFTTDPRMIPWRESALQRGYRSGVALPLKDENTQVFGVLLIYHPEPDAMTPNEIQLMEELAVDLAFGVSGLRARVQRNLAEEALALRNRVNEIFLIFPSDEMYGEVLEVILEAMNSKYGVFAYIDEDGVAIAPSLTRDVWEKCYVPQKSIVFPRDTWGNSMWGKTITEKRSIYSNEPFDVPEGHLPINRALDVPILYQGEVIGHFLVGNKESDYDDQDKDKLEGIARAISPILNARIQSDRQEQRRWQAEEELRASEERFRSLFEDSPISIWEEDFSGVKSLLNDLQKRGVDDIEAYLRQYPEVVKQCADLVKITDVNQASLDLYEAANKEELCKGLWKVFTLESYATFQRELISLWKGHREMVSEAVVKTLGGKSLQVMVYFSVCPGYEETVSKVLVSTIDITELKQAEQDLRESEAFYRSLYENISDCIFIIDVTLDGRFKFVGFNPAEERAVGMTTEQVANKFPEDIVSKDVAEQVNSRYQMCVEKRQTIHYEEALDLPKGKISFLTSLVPIEGSDGGIYRIIGVARDITEQKKLERQLFQAQKMEAIGTLAGGIAHDFNNILQVISGNTELLELELAQKDMRFSEMDAIRHASDRGGDLVKQLLTFSRRIEPKLEIINLNGNVKNVERLLYRTIPKMIDIELRLEDELKPIQADSNQVEQILLNMAVNAKDSMPKGGRLAITTQNLNVEDQYCKVCGEKFAGQYVLITVSDTGYGMSEDTLQHVFEPFFTTKKPGEGTGLGLATVLGIMKLHGGHIMCESEVGKGSTFFMYFPVSETAKPHVKPKQDDTAVTEGVETILVVDDEQLIADLAKKILEKAGYSVMTANSGREALDVYSEKKTDIDLVILDLIMPEMSGEDCLKELLKMNPQVKALVASGFAIKGETKVFIDMQAKGRVEKPFKIRELLHSVRQVLDEP